MKRHRKHMDYDLGQEICRELRAGNRRAILEIYTRYSHFFEAFTRHRLFDDDPHAVESVLSNFWLELVNAKAICGFKGKSSLQTYLTVILNRRIIDANREFGCDHSMIPITQEKESEANDHRHNQQTPEKALIVKEQHRLIQKALLQLSDISPRDADLIRMNLEGMSYEQMAIKELNGKNDDPAELKRRVDAIKKQFTRKETGSLEKFRSVLSRYLDTNGLNYTDLLH